MQAIEILVPIILLVCVAVIAVALWFERYGQK